MLTVIAEGEYTQGQHVPLDKSHHLIFPDVIECVCCLIYSPTSHQYCALHLPGYTNVEELSQKLQDFKETTQFSACNAICFGGTTTRYRLIPEVDSTVLFGRIKSLLHQHNITLINPTLLEIASDPTTEKFISELSPSAIGCGLGYYAGSLLSATIFPTAYWLKTCTQLSLACLGGGYQAYRSLTSTAADQEYKSRAFVIDLAKLSQLRSYVTGYAERAQLFHLCISMEVMAAAQQEGSQAVRMMTPQTTKRLIEEKKVAAIKFIQGKRDHASHDRKHSCLTQVSPLAIQYALFLSLIRQHIPPESEFYQEHCLTINNLSSRNL